MRVCGRCPQRGSGQAPAYFLLEFTVTVFRFDKVVLTPEIVREEVRDFIADIHALMQPMPMGFSPEFSRAMAVRGWIAMI